MASEDDKGKTSSNGDKPSGSTQGSGTRAPGSQGAGSKPAGAQGGTSPGTGSQSASSQGTGAQGSGARASGTTRSKPVTIDLKAEEVRKQAEKDAAGKPRPGDAATAAAASSSGTSASSAPKADAAARPAGPTSPAGATTGATTGATAGSASATSSAKSAPTAASDAPASSGGFAKPLAAAILGGALALGGAYALGPYLGGGNSAEVEQLQLALGDAQARFRQLEDQLTEIRKTEAGPTVAPSVVEALSKRIAQMEESAGAIRDSSGEDRKTAETLRADVDVLTEGLSEIRRFMSSGSAGEGAALATLSDTVQQVQEDVSTLRGSLEGDLAGRLNALESGEGQKAQLETALKEIEERLASLDGRINTAAEAANAAAKAATEGDTVASSTISALSERVDTLGTAMEKSGQRAATIETGLAEARNGIGGVETSVKQITERLAALDTRIAEIETVIGGPGAREMASRAVAVSLLKSSVDSGRSYVTELAAVRKALPEDTDLTALEAGAETGIPRITQLVSRFPEVAREMAGTLEKVETGNSVVDKFLNNARSLVSVRATGEVTGGGPMAAIGRMEAHVREGDLDTALEIYETLPDGTQAAGKEWAADARARLAADQLVDQATADVIKALAASDS